MTYKLCSKIWIENDGKMFGDGPCDILEKVDRLGSLRKAAHEMKMSYSQAWKLLNMLENNLGFPLLVRQARGSSLTEEGKKLLLRFIAFRRDVDLNLERLYKKHFLDNEVKFGK